ncbi:hypothetical protein NDU88_004498 [Pleurodeles waltl]|uniref:ribonuclease H n=1 Tax=Pleurodeles waltl TaxID=8319 RepID=A0AAV7RIB7_PLEWA|nr:hypothetical protein NDU88_004498 [Pleurodeles waltl]
MPLSYNRLSDDHLALLRKKVAVLLAKGAIERVPVPEEGCGCYSCYFLVPKKDKGFRPIVELLALKLFLRKEKFEMMILAQVLSASDPGDWMVALYLQDAYFHIPVLPAHRHYLLFVEGHKHFQLTMLPFGLTSAPWVFMKVIAVVVAHLCRLRVSIFLYLDDWLLRASTPQTVVFHLETTANLLHSLGFTINMLKSHLTPSQALPFIRAVLDIVQFGAYTPEKQVQYIQAMILMFLPLSCILVRKTLGLIISCTLLVTYARWHMWALQWDL